MYLVRVRIEYIMRIAQFQIINTTFMQINICSSDSVASVMIRTFISYLLKIDLDGGHFVI